MRKKIRLLVAYCFIAGITLISCKPSNEKMEDAKEDVVEAKEAEANAEENLTEVKADTASDYALLKAQTKKLIAENETRIAEFKMKLKTETAVKQKKFQTEIDQLEAKNNVLKSDLNAYKEEGKEKWNAFKNRLQKSVDDVNKDIQEYKKEH